MIGPKEINSKFLSTSHFQVLSFNKILLTTNIFTFHNNLFHHNILCNILLLFLHFREQVFSVTPNTKEQLTLLQNLEKSSVSNFIFLLPEMM